MSHEPWGSTALVPVPKNAGDATALVPFARQLSTREQQQIVQAFKAESYEMMSSFVWGKAMGAVKRQLESLGMEFVGEMLGRPDIDAHTPIDRAVTDHEAIRLASDLGMFSPLEGMRLRHSLEVVSHFMNASDPNEQMTREEAISCLRASIENVLGHEDVSVATKFVDFRKALESKVFDENDQEVLALLAAPYIFRRTTLSVLLAAAKTASAAVLELALANLNVILPKLWPELRAPERWQTGQTYAEVSSEGRSQASAGVKKALLKVKGFDYVPESLRSHSFAQAAQKVLEAHDAWDNFHNEPAAIAALASMGTSIPPPALPICMQAALCVQLGNGYGYSFAAVTTSEKLLRELPVERWVYYLDECLPGDLRILGKLLESKPRSRWIDLFSKLPVTSLALKNAQVRKLVAATKPAGDAVAIERAAKSLFFAEARATPQ